jgi:hypothetical protein|tara:strand:+ start:414 stop:785 length:372 start_codon:yes stop_codon:yes gene_type:complete
MKKFILLLTVITTLTLTSCATLFGPKSHSLSATSNPQGAEIYVDGERMGVTPLKLELDPSKTYSIEYRKKGYRSITKIVKGKVGVKWIVLDILGGLIPVVIDAATGNWYEFEKDRINANLENN